MRDFKNKVVWITGASSGIGEALVKAFDRLGAKLVLSARNEGKLNELKGGLQNNENCIVIPLDLADSSSFDQLAKQVNDQFGSIDLLINNGGISQRSLIRETPLEIDRRVFEVNYFGTIALTKAVLPYFIQQKGGQVLVISSVVGLFGFPLRSAYSASKHALHGFFETLAIEERLNNIKVTVACPGRVRTNVSINAITKEGKEQGTMDHGINEGITPENCAKQLIKALRKEKRMVLIGGKETLLARIKRFSPWAYFKISSNVKPT